jgi:type I restriction enzyme, R subunit
VVDALNDVLNERFGTEFTSSDELFWEQVRTDATADESVRDAGEANTIDNFAHVFDRKLEELVIGRMERNSNQVVRFLDDPEIRDVVTRLMRNQRYTAVSGTKLSSGDIGVFRRKIEHV